MTDQTHIERPILFSAPMVRAILEGRKTMTRRIVSDRHLRLIDTSRAPMRATWTHPVPYGKPGDRLWVREGFKPVASGQVKDGHGEVRYGHAYKADSAVRWAEHPTIIHDLTGQPDTGPMQFRETPWKPSIHMPRRASRILLEVTEVRVERLQEITGPDAVAEGIDMDGHDSWHPSNQIATFRRLWQSINGPDSWALNPWVWAVSFKRLTP